LKPSNDHHKHLTFSVKTLNFVMRIDNVLSATLRGFPNEFAVTGILKEVGGYVVLGLRASPCEGFEI
jgi:hypothetical protein